MDDEINLRVPGPTPLPPQVREVLSRQMMNHRSAGFEAIMEEVHGGLQEFYATGNPVLTFPASGTGGLEASVVNVLSPGDEVIAVTIGAFGERFAQIATAFGLHLHRLDYEWGQAASPADIGALLHEHPATRAVLMTQNETSTGVLNPIEEMARSVRANWPDILLLVDAISGLGAAPLLADAWDLDVVVSGSQKAWMVPPGMTMLSVSERAWEAHRSARLPRLYWDFTAARKANDLGQPPYTPAVSLFYALQVALRLMRQEGREAIWARHAALAARTRDGVRRLGLELLADPAHYSPSVTAVRVPEGVDLGALLSSVQERHNVVFAGGQGRLSGRIFRIGHLGWVDAAAIDKALLALQDGLEAQGWAGRPQAAGV
jgi:aspartate aminotransferase-like enzyme